MEFQKEIDNAVQKVVSQHLGFIDFKEAWDLQEKLLAENVQLKLEYYKNSDPFSVPTSHHLLFCEHPSVYTLGKSGKRSNLMISEEEFLQKGIQFYHINRGGDITYHGPGQIVGYPILDLEKFKTDITWYLRSLEEVIIRCLREFSVKGERIEGATGVWIDANSSNTRKICAMGIKCSRWISMHGFAFNISTDLNYFQHIIPCGIADKGVTSLEIELGQKVDYEYVLLRLKHHFKEVFHCKLV